MTNHPIHLHGHEFEVTCTDGGWTRPELRRPEVTVDCAVGQMRAVEFIASQPGDWAFHCHKSHHTMNAMGHDVKTYIGVDLKSLKKEISKVIPGGYMPMGQAGGADMAAMEMPLPDNTLPMMTGQGPYGAVEMGGMFTIVKYARGLSETTTRTPAGTSIPKVPSPTNGRATWARPPSCQPRQQPPTISKSAS